MNLMKNPPLSSGLQAWSQATVIDFCFFGISRLKQVPYSGLNKILDKGRGPSAGSPGDRRSTTGYCTLI